MKRLILIVTLLGLCGVASAQSDLTSSDLSSNKVRCPVCVREGKRSKVYPGWTLVTAMGITDYYDEDGNHIYEDPNISTTEYGCSNGHGWSEARKGGKLIRVTEHKTDKPKGDSADKEPIAFRSLSQHGDLSSFDTSTLVISTDTLTVNIGSGAKDDCTLQNLIQASRDVDKYLENPSDGKYLHPQFHLDQPGSGPSEIQNLRLQLERLEESAKSISRLRRILANCK